MVGNLPVSTAPPPAPPSLAGGFAFRIEGIPSIPGDSCISPALLVGWVFQAYVDVTPLCPGVVSNCTDLNSPI